MRASIPIWDRPSDRWVGMAHIDDSTPVRILGVSTPITTAAAFASFANSSPVWDDHAAPFPDEPNIIFDRQPINAFRYDGPVEKEYWPDGFFLPAFRCFPG